MYSAQLSLTRGEASSSPACWVIYGRNQGGGGDTLDAGGESWLLDVEFGGGMSCASAQLL